MNPTEKDLSKLSTITAAIVLYPENYMDYIGYARTVSKSEFMIVALNDLEQELKESRDLHLVLSRLAGRHSVSGKYAARALSWNLLNRDNLL